MEIDTMTEVNKLNNLLYRTAQNILNANTNSPYYGQHMCDAYESMYKFYVKVNGLKVNEFIIYDRNHDKIKSKLLDIFSYLKKISFTCCTKIRTMAKSTHLDMKNVSNMFSYIYSMAESLGGIIPYIDVIELVYDYDDDIALNYNTMIRDKINILHSVFRATVEHDKSISFQKPEYEPPFPNDISKESISESYVRLVEKS